MDIPVHRCRLALVATVPDAKDISARARNDGSGEGEQDQIGGYLLPPVRPVRFAMVACVCSLPC